MTDTKISPTLISYHVYDLNVNEIYKKLDSLVENGNEMEKKEIEKLKSRLIDQAKNYCENHSIDFNKYFKNNAPLIIRPQDNTYHYFLSLSLICFDIHRIHSYLNYHYETINGNYYAKDKRGFIGLIEFIVYNQVVPYSPFNGDLRAEKIMQWVDKRRSDDKINVTIFDNKLIVINEVQLDVIYEALRKNFSESDQSKLFNLLKGEPIEGKIIFMGEGNKLLDAFKKMQEIQIIFNSKRNVEMWFAKYFQYSSKGKVTDFTEQYAHDIISSNKQPCKHPIQQIDNLINNFSTH
jgi:hypothetical protein